MFNPPPALLMHILSIWGNLDNLGGAGGNSGNLMGPCENSGHLVGLGETLAILGDCWGLILFLLPLAIVVVVVHPPLPVYELSDCWESSSNDISSEFSC